MPAGRPVLRVTKMQVAIESVGIHAHLEETFGLPTPTQNKMDELFGYYHTTYDDEEGPRFWLYSPMRKLWRVK